MKRLTIGAAVLLAVGTMAGGTTAASAAEPSPTFRIVDLVTTGCGSGEFGFYALTTGMPLNAGYLVRTVATVDGKTYTDEAADVEGAGEDETFYWSLYDLFTYGGSPTAGRGTWPMPAGEEVVATFTLIDGSGTVLDTWKTVFDSCLDGEITYNGPFGVADDADGDGIPAGVDECPTLSFFTGDGCPPRTLTLTHRTKADRLVGTLTSAGGGAATYARARVQVWELRRGQPHVKVAVVRTTGSGRFFVPRGVTTAGRKYYATTRGVALDSGDTLVKVRSASVQVP